MRVPSSRYHTRSTMAKGIQVMATSEIVVNWVKAEADFMCIDLTTEEGKRWFDKQCERRAIRYVKQANSL